MILLRVLRGWTIGPSWVQSEPTDRLRSNESLGNGGLTIERQVAERANVMQITMSAVRYRKARWNYVCSRVRHGLPGVC